MRSRYQGVCIDMLICLFTYNIIALLLMRNDSMERSIFNIGVSVVSTTFLL